MKLRMRHLSVAFRKARQIRGMTLAELAIASGVHKNTIYRLEAGEGVNVETCMAIAAAIDFNFSRIVREAENITPVTTNGDRLLTASKMVQ